MHNVILDVARTLRDCAEALEKVSDPQPYVDQVAQMPINAWPSHPDFVRNFGKGMFWPMRELNEITGLTIHHTLSHSSLGTAQYCTSGKGYPTIQYHYWVSADEGCPVYRLADERWALWHDHTGVYQTTLSIGLAGRWDYYTPAMEQIEALARLVAWAMNEFAVPLDQVWGHKARALRANVRTVCPGWDAAGWKNVFFAALRNVPGV